jgi:hypothetical protein
MQPLWQDMPLSLSPQPRHTSRHPLDNVVRHELGQGRCQSDLDSTDTGWPLYMSNCHHIRVFILSGAAYE